MKLLVSMKIWKKKFPKLQGKQIPGKKKPKWCVHFVIRNVPYTAKLDGYQNVKCAGCGLDGSFIPKEDLGNDFLF